MRLSVLVVSLIPFHLGQRIGRVLGRLFAPVLKGRFKVSLEGLRTAYGSELTEKELIDLNRRVILHFSQMAFEVPHILRLRRENLSKYVVFENEKRLFNALEKGKGVFILTGHFGNWELMSAAMAVRIEKPGAVVARPIDFYPAERIISDLRSNFGTDIIPKQRGIRKILKAVQENRAVGILLDQNVAWYEGVFVPFFGKLACTNKGLALMAQKTGTPVVPVFSVRQKDGRYLISFGEEVEAVRRGNKVGDIEETTNVYMKIIERQIRRHPDHWFWFHRRWKTVNSCPLPEDYFEASAP